MRSLLVVFILKNLFILLIIIIFIAKKAMNIFNFILKKNVNSHKAAVVKSDLIPTILSWVHIDQ